MVKQWNMENKELQRGDLVTIRLFGKVRSYQITRTDEEYAYHDFSEFGKEPLKFKKEYGYDRDTNTFDITMVPEPHPGFSEYSVLL